ncbi:MAG: FAD-dependent oxidoreductase, partial [Ktedonobacteraceae bacterium]|nr:FAD-dependent oxidoreductase [Ktedonobacteraceae bacterium]
VVLAVGPWVHRLLGELHLPVRLTRQYLLYFTGLPANAFKVDNFPSFIADDLYGFPLCNTCTGEGPAWLKATSHRAGPPVDPDAVPVVDQNAVAFIKNRLCELLPDLLHADLVHVDACIYDMSQDEDFILDAVPGDPRVVFAAGMSGHAFKFGLLLGEMISSMLGGREPPVPLDRFRLNRFSLSAQMGKTSVA